MENKENGFAALGLADELLKALSDVGYEAPTPIQGETIPPLLAGRDIIGQAQTGTGKTAAFALPMLQAINPDVTSIQGLVLVPTRELALQVSEALHTYARHMKRVSILPVYGGAPFPPQLTRLKRGVHIIVGTPGRVMDHMRRASMTLKDLRFLVLDEADEMLRMGFAEDVEWILGQTNATRQIALFTATLPPKIKAIAKTFLKDPISIQIAQKTLTVPTVEQLYLNLSENQKLDALTRLLGVEKIDAALIFTRTKNGAAELAEKLDARGFAAEALHGDMSQAQRENLLRRFRGKQVDIMVATDVAARGLDVEHISHVFNYDMPNDVEAFVHRIGRTGRAGRTGIAVLFATPRERRMLRDIETYTGQRMKPIKMPTKADVAARNITLFKETLKSAMGAGDLDLYLSLVEEMADEGGFDMAEVAAAAVKMALGDKEIKISIEPDDVSSSQPEEGMARLFISAGSKTGVRPADVVGAIANEGGVPGSEIGSVDVYERFTFVEVPLRHRDRVLKKMSKTTLRGQVVTLKVAEPDKGKRGEAAESFQPPAPRFKPAYKPGPPKGGKPFQRGKPTGKPRR